MSRERGLLNHLIHLWEGSGGGKNWWPPAKHPRALFYITYKRIFRGATFLFLLYCLKKNMNVSRPSDVEIL